MYIYTYIYLYIYINKSEHSAQKPYNNRAFKQRLVLVKKGIVCYVVALISRLSEDLDIYIKRGDTRGM